MTTMVKWEYFVIDLSGNAGEELPTIMKLGQQGWELVSVVSEKMCRRAYFKRPANVTFSTEAVKLMREADHMSRIHAGCEPPKTEPKSEVADTGEFPAVTPQ